MSRRPRSRFVASIAGAVIGVTLVAAVLPLPTLLLWNASASAPIGLYRVNPLARPAVGDIVAFAPPPALARFMAQRHYLPLGVPLLKHVAARGGSLICRRGGTVTIDGRIIAVARASDSRSRPLPAWRGCRVLKLDELFLLNPAPDSFDSRYFGPVPASGLIGRAAPILTRGTPDAWLRWRSACAPNVPLITEEGEIPCR